MPNFFGEPERKGGQGRVPESKRPQYKLYQKVNVTIDPETFARLEQYCEDNERARSWVIQKALADWLASQGY